jgi:hypothetical protein
LPIVFLHTKKRVKTEDKPGGGPDQNEHIPIQE